MRAWLNLRHVTGERARLYSTGLKRLGYKVEAGTTLHPRAGDALITWNRIGIGNQSAKVFESLGLPVLVTENAAWGNEFAGERWYTLARSRHNTAGMFPIGDSERWDRLGIDLAPWRHHGETVILPQRGIGAEPTKQPPRWVDKFRDTGFRVRWHPGIKPCIPLEEDLRDCAHVITWGSGAAIKALMMGIKVTSYMPNWVGEQDNTDEGRLAMFRRLAWGQASHAEIEDGTAFVRLLE